MKIRTKLSKRFFLSLLLSIASLLVINTAYAEKIDLKILYVGYDPARPMPEKVVYFSIWEPAISLGYKTRMKDFKMYLNDRFTNVQVIDVRDYKPSISQNVDVTIFDAGPVNLPADFDRPAILLHAMAPNIGIPIHLKFDWYCQCLEDDALNVDLTHEIFNAPIKVRPTMIEKPTPLSFFNGHQAATTPKTMKMWNVVKANSSKQGKYLIGMVSHGEGFSDSPDAEVISGGDCLKNAEAVAIGRHGNFLMWGFAASPEYMTEEAKNVFANSISYIKKYDHKPVIVRKTQTATRAEIDELIYRIDEDLYKKALVARKEGNARLLKMQKELRDKKAAGENVGRSNEMFLLMPVTNDLQAFTDYLKQFVGEELFLKFGTDTKLYHQYFRDNYEYFYPQNEMSLRIDTDVKSLAISNRDPLLLEKCVSMLEVPSKQQLANRLLERYTNEHFKTASEWQNWLSVFKSRVFFSESGGFKFFADSSVVNNQAFKRTPIIEDESEDPIASDPVKISFKLVKSVNSKAVKLIVTAKILAGWHIYAYVPNESPFVQSKLKLVINGRSLKAKWQSTPGIALNASPQTFVFENVAEFSTVIPEGSARIGNKISCGLYYQVCNDNKCFPPQEKNLQVIL
jgi:hypothetical protein